MHINCKSEIYNIHAIHPSITKALFVTDWNDKAVFWCSVSVWHHEEILTLTTDAERSVYTIIGFHVVQWLEGLQYGLISF